jgi:anti-sigma factor RsiW
LGFFEGIMHGFIRDRLEDLLADGETATEDAASMKHLSSCAACAAEVASMKEQAGALRTLRAPEEVQPAAGFYARVLQRIDERARESMWAPFIYSPFAKRLVYASLTLAVMLGTYVITAETRDGHLTGERIVAQQLQQSALVVGSPEQQRDAVLANFALHPEGSLQ